MRARTLAALPLVLLVSVHAPRVPRFRRHRRRPLRTTVVRRSAPDTASVGLVFDRIDTRYRFREDGTGSITREMRAVPTSRAGVTAIGHIPFYYVAGRQRFELRHLRVIRPGGKAVTAGPEAVHDGTAPVAQEAPVFTDVHLAHVVVPDLHPGDTVDIQVEVDILEPLAPGRFWVDMPFIDLFPVHGETVEVDVPSSRPIQWWSAEGRKPRVSHPEAGRTVYAWSHSSPGRNLDASNAASLLESQAAPSIELSSFPSWKALAAWYGALADSAARATPAVKARALELVQGATDDRAKVRALYRYVSGRIRYVSLQLGQGAFRPHPADSVMIVGYGDCKDQAALLASLLAAVGIHSEPVLVDTRSTRQLRTSVPSPAQFDHVVTVVPLGKDTLWLDPTSGVAPPGFLPTSVRGTRGLLVEGPAGGRLVTAPSRMPYANLSTLDVRGSVTPGGTLVATFDERFEGDVAVGLRALFRQVDASQLDHVFTAVLSSMGVGGKAYEGRVSDPDSTDEPYWMHFVDSAGSYVKLDSAVRDFTLPIEGIARNVLDDTAASDTALTLGGPATETDRVRITFPRGVRPRAPAGIRLDRSWASYRSSYRVEGRTLVAERTLEVKAASLPRDSVPALKALAGAVRAENRRPVRLAVDLHELPAPDDARIAPGLVRSAARDLANGHYVRAADEARRAVEADSTLVSGWYDLAQALDRQKKWPEAETAARHALRAAPYRQWIRNELGLILQRKGDLAGADAAFRQEIQLFPLEYAANVNLLNVLTMRGRLDSAIAQGRQTVAVAPDSASGHKLLAAALLKADSTRAALGELRKANRLDPSDSWTAGQLTLLLSREGEGKEAVRLVRGSGAAASEDPMRRAAAAAGLVQAGTPDSAVALMRRGLARHPKSGMWHFATAWVLTYIGRYSKALPDARAAVLLDGKKAEEWMLLGRLESFDNDPKDALHAYRKSIAIDSTVLKRSQVDREIYLDLSGNGS